MVGVIGRNGAGKTTLMRSVMGLIGLRTGSITFDGADLVAIPAHGRDEARDRLRTRRPPPRP